MTIQMALAALVADAGLSQKQTLKVGLDALHLALRRP